MTDIKNLLERGVEEVIGKEHLEAALRGNPSTGLKARKLRVKFGIDPTAPDLHLGHTVPLRKLRQFQDAGHKAVLIIGDFTAKIGDPSGRDKTRPMLTDKEIKQNFKTYLKQAKKVLLSKNLEINFNSKWHAKMKLPDIFKLLGDFTVQQMIEREDFSNRIKNQKPLWAHEFMYPAMQAYDSVMVKADVEIGGTDQRFNLIAGRELMAKRGIEPQDLVMLPLLVGMDGVKKMSKSYGNHIGITEAPNAMFGKIMSVPDELIDKYYELCTDEKRAISDPREAKLKLGEIIVGMYHSAKAAEKSKEEFIRVFSKHEVPSEVKSLKLIVNSLSLIDLLLETKMAVSRSEAKRLIEQGGVKLNNEKQTDPNKIVKIAQGTLLQVGKTRFLKLI